MRIGELIFDVVVNATQALRGLGRFRDQVGRVSARLRSMTLSMAKWGAGIAAAFTGAVAVALNSTADRIERLGREAENYGIELEKLQELQFIGKQQGIEIDAVSDAVKTLAENIGEMQLVGTGPLAELEEFNPALLDAIVNTGNMSESLDILLGAMRNTESSEQRLRLSILAFGDEAGTAMASMAQLSREEVAAMMQQARENGLLTQENIDTAKEYNRSLRDMADAVRGAIDRALLPLMPYLTDIASGLSDWIRANKELINQNVKDVFNGIKEGLKPIADGLKELVQDGKLGERIGDLFRSFGNFLRMLSENAETVAMVTKWGSALLAFGMIMGPLITIISALTPVLAGLFALMIANPITILVTAVAGLVFALQDLIRWFGGAETALSPLWDRLADFGAWLGTGLADAIYGMQQAWANATQSMSEAWSSFAGRITDSQPWRTLEGFGASIGIKLADTIYGISLAWDTSILGIKDAFASFRDAVFNIIDTVIQKWQALVSTITDSRLFQALGTARNFVGDAGSAVSGAVSGAGERLSGFGNSILERLNLAPSTSSSTVDNSTRVEQVKVDIHTTGRVDGSTLANEFNRAMEKQNRRSAHSTLGTATGG